MAKIANPYTVDFDRLAPLYEAKKSKVYNFKEEDFSIDLLTLKWRHNTWKTWMAGAADYTATKEMIKKYCIECNKPYGEGDLSEFHLAED